MTVKVNDKILLFVIILVSIILSPIILFTGSLVAVYESMKYAIKGAIDNALFYVLIGLAMSYMSYLIILFYVWVI